MDTAHWPQNIGLMKPLPSMPQIGVAAAAAAPNTTAATSGATCSSARPAPPQAADRRSRPQKEQALNCPRCNSTNTKFCYYNNYSLTQPRYFCKTCRRYWTEGGSLRNVPVGGGSRKNKRSSSSSTTTASTSGTSAAASSLQPKRPPPTFTAAPPLPPPNFNPNSLYEPPQDLNLAYQFGEFSSATSNSNSSTTVASTTAGLSAVELLRGGNGIPTIGLSSSTPFFQQTPMSADSDAVSVYQPGMFGLQGFRATGNFGFTANELNAAYCNMVQEGGGGGGGRVVFPFEDLSQSSQVPAADFERGNIAGAGASSEFWSTTAAGGGGGGAMGLGGGGGPAAW